MAERDDEVDVHDDVDHGVSIEVPDEVPDRVKKSVGRANVQAAKFRLRSHEAEANARSGFPSDRRL